jgi:hypothetical protein
MNITVFWDVTPCSPLSVNRRFGGTYRLHLQDRKNKLSKHSAFKLVSCWTYFFDPEDGGDIFLRNIGWHWTDYTASYPRRWYSSDFYLFSSIFPGKCRDSAWIKPRPLPSKSLQIQHSSVILPLDASLATDPAKELKLLIGQEKLFSLRSTKINLYI